MAHNRKKIVFIINNFDIGGAEKVILNILRFLESETHVLSVYGSGPNLMFFQKNAHKVHQLGFGGVNSSVVVKFVWVVFSPLVFLRVIFYLLKVRPDTVVTSLSLGDMVGITAAFLVRVPNRIVIQHDVEKFNGCKGYLKKLVVSKLTTKVVAVSNSVSEFLKKELNVPYNKINIIKNGVDTLELRNINNNDSRRLSIGFLGRLEEVKGVDILLKSLHELLNRELEFDCLIAGDGSKEGSLKSFVKNNEMENVQFLGHVDNPSKILSRIDVLVVPSLEEGFGLVVLEALFAGIVVIASDLPAFREFINEDNGLLFEVGNSNDLSEKLESILLNRDKLKLIREGVIVWSEANEEKYSLSFMRKEYKEVLFD